MQEPWTIVGAILLAVLVGAALPVLFQLYSTLRRTRRMLDRLGPKLDNTLAEVREAGRRLKGVGSSLEQSTRRAEALFDAVGDIGVSVGKLRDSLKNASTISEALGPAIAAAIGVLTELGSKRRSDDTNAPSEEAGVEEREALSR